MNIEEKVRAIICEQLSVAEDVVVTQASFVDDLGADSLDLVEMIMAMEEAFNISIADEDAEKIKTVQDAIDYLRDAGISDDASQAAAPVAEKPTAEAPKPKVEAKVEKPKAEPRAQKPKEQTKG